LNLSSIAKVWRLPGDMAHFKGVTSSPTVEGKRNAVIMGRKTWDSIPPKFRPLDNRMNVILSRSDPEKICTDENVLVCSSLTDAMEKLKVLEDVGCVFVIGGGQVYEESIKSGLVNRIIYTEVNNLDKDIKFDTWFPELDASEWECVPFPGQEAPLAVEEEKKEESLTASVPAIVHTDKKSGVTYKFLEYRRKSNKKQKVQTNEEYDDCIEEGPHVNPEEMQYLAMCRDIIENGVERGDRTGTGTMSKFGTQMRFSLRDGTLPLLTTKRTFWRGVAEELLWFVAVSHLMYRRISTFLLLFAQPKYLYIHLKRETPMPMTWQQRIFISGMVTVQENS
jgi:dihydrofolate reductase / thymidylate synthase